MPAFLPWKIKHSFPAFQVQDSLGPCTFCSRDNSSQLDLLHRPCSAIKCFVSESSSKFAGRLYPVMPPQGPKSKDIPLLGNEQEMGKCSPTSHLAPKSWTSASSWWSCSSIICTSRGVKGFWSTAGEWLWAILPLLHSVFLSSLPGNGIGRGLWLPWFSHLLARKTERRIQYLHSLGAKDNHLRCSAPEDSLLAVMSWREGEYKLMPLTQHCTFQAKSTSHALAIACGYPGHGKQEQHYNWLCHFHQQPLHHSLLFISGVTNHFPVLTGTSISHYGAFKGLSVINPLDWLLAYAYATITSAAGLQASGHSSKVWNRTEK